MMLNEHVSSEQYGIGFKKGNTELRNQVQEALNEMLADGTFNEIAQKWKLEESVCLGQSGADEVFACRKRTDTEEKFCCTAGRNHCAVKNGMFATLGIFILTLVFSLPLGLVITFIRMSKVKLLQWIAKIYISIMRGTPLMPQPSGCIFRTILPVWHFTVILVSFLCSYYWFCIKLCGIFCRNLPRRYRSCSGRTV